MQPSGSCAGSVFGMMLRVVAWPMGFVVLAKGAQQVFFWTEVAATFVHVGLAWLLVTQVGLAGAGAAFFGLYVWHGSLIYVIVRQLTGFRWSAATGRVLMVFLPLTVFVFLSFYLFPTWLATSTGIVAALLSGAYSARALVSLLPPQAIPSVLRFSFLRADESSRTTATTI